MTGKTANSKQQTANSKQQTANSKQQTANSKQQTANIRTRDVNVPFVSVRGSSLRFFLARLSLSENACAPLLFAVCCLLSAVCRLPSAVCCLLLSLAKPLAKT
jgi:hypothetical protein